MALFGSSELDLVAREEVEMLQGNRKLAAIMAGLLIIGSTVILGTVFGVDGATLMTAIGIEGTLATGGIITFKGSD